VATASAATRHLDDLFAQADRRLYLAKATGRDRVVGDAPDEDSAALDASAG
jgi:PleD family two-component response regulator